MAMFRETMFRETIARDIRIGTRGSRLALWQADYVAARLADAGMVSSREVIVTKGDMNLDKPLPEMGDKGVFTAELDRALLNGSIDLAVHSLKDLPTTLPDGLKLTAVPVRADPRDVFVSRLTEVTSLASLPDGAIVATGSLRRGAQLRALRPDIRTTSVRGNIETRLSKLMKSEWDGMILAAAGLHRLGLEHQITEYLDPAIMVPGVAQGALGIVTASKLTTPLVDMIRRLDDPVVHQIVLAERAFLRHLKGGCQTPIGALGQSSRDGVLSLDGMVASLDGSHIIRGQRSGPVDDPESVGTGLAQDLISRGAGDLLSAIEEQSA